MGKDSLVLNGGTFDPLTVLSWKRSVTLVYQEKVYVVEEYDDWTVASPSTEYNVPSIVSLFDHVPHDRQVPFTRRNIYARDEFRCQYCGTDAKSADSNVNKSDLTFDHVVPKSRDGETTWQNIVTCCEPCNLKKGDDLPCECEMSLINEPKKPSTNPLLLELKGKNVPEEWNEYFKRDL